MLAGATGLVPALAGVLLQEIAFGLSDPVQIAWTNEHVAAAERATVLSVRSMSYTLGGSAGLLAIGLLARAQGIPAAFAASAVLFALTVPGLLVLGRAARRTALGAGAEAVVTPAA